LNNKKTLIPIIASIFLIPSVLAQNQFSSVLSPLSNAVSTFANFIFLNLPGTIGPENYIRLLIGILLFTVFYAVLVFLPWQNSPFKRKNIALPISAVISIMSVVFMPGQMLILIANSYGFVTSFLLLAVPVMAVLILTYRIFSTSAEKIPDVGLRRVNHGIKAVIFYFLATLVTNYSKVQALTANFPAGWIDMTSLVVAAAMFLFVYHLIMIMFTTAPAREGEAGEPGIIERALQPTAPRENVPEGERPARPGERQRREQDFGPIEGAIGQLSEQANTFEQAANQFSRDSARIRAIPEDQFETSEDRRTFENNAMGLRALGLRIESFANAIADYTELFPNMPERVIVRLNEAIRTINRSNELIVDAIINATG